MEAIKPFLVRAKQHTYANSTGKTSSSRLNSYDLEYEEDDFIYRDSYFGNLSFSGQEIVWYKNEPVWSMNYYGDVLSPKFNSSFLKSALMFPTIDLPYRGQTFYREDDYTYIMETTGNFNKFSGSEKIFFKDLLTYELFFHGGKIIDKNFK